MSYDKQNTTPQPAKLNARAASWVGLVVGLCLGVALSWMAPANAARNGSGTYSLPNTGSVPNPVVSGTTITSTWANGTLSDISTEITNSLDRGGRGAMTAPLQLASGSVTAPGLTFSGDTNTGLYRVGADNIALVTAGTSQLAISSTAITATLPTSITTSIAASTGLTATGYTTGHGVWGYGGNGSGGGTKGVGVMGIAGTYGTAGGYFQGSTGGAAGTANGGAAVYASAYPGYGGIGVTAVGADVSDGGTGGVAVSAQGGSSSGGIGANGINATAGSGSSVANAGIGVVATAGAASTGADRSTSVKLVSGDIEMDDPAEVTYSTSIKNRLTPTNLVKAWGIFTTGGGGDNCSETDGFNFTSCSCSANNVTVVVGQDFADANYHCSVSGGDDWNEFCVCTNRAAGTFSVRCGDGSVDTQINLCTTATTISFLAIGKQ